MTFGWTDIDDIAIELDEAHPSVDPVAVSFPDLRSLIEGLEGFEPEPGQQVNEQILEAVQGAWIEERQDAAGHGGADDADDAEDEGPGKFNPLR